MSHVTAGRHNITQPYVISVIACDEYGDADESRSLCVLYEIQYWDSFAVFVGAKVMLMLMTSR